LFSRFFQSRTKKTMKSAVKPGVKTGAVK